MNKVGDDIGQLFRLAMRRFPAAVTIVTTRYQGEDVGMTATAVTSLSMDPPSLLLCVNRGNGFHTPIEENQDRRMSASLSANGAIRAAFPISPTPRPAFFATRRHCSATPPTRSSSSR